MSFLLGGKLWSLVCAICVLLVEGVIASNSQWYVNGSAHNTASIQPGSRFLATCSFTLTPNTNSYAAITLTDPTLPTFSDKFVQSITILASTSTGMGWPVNSPLLNQYINPGYGRYLFSASALTSSSVIGYIQLFITQAKKQDAAVFYCFSSDGTSISTSTLTLTVGSSSGQAPTRARAPAFLLAILAFTALIELT